MPYQYELTRHIDPGTFDPGNEKYPDLAMLKGDAQKIRDGVASLIHAGSPEDAVRDRRSLKLLKEMEEAALAIANEIANVRLYWQEG